MKFHNRLSVALLGLITAAAAIQTSSAAVSPYSWIRAGETGNVFADSSGNNKNFNAAFSSIGGGNPAAVIVSTAVGGPLGNTGASSTASTRWGFYNVANSGMWVQGPNNSVPLPELWGLPATNWVMEAWVLPVGQGATLERTESQLVSTGSGHFGGRPGGAAFRSTYSFEDGLIRMRADAIGVGAAENFTIGDPVVVPTNQWTHLAVVNDGGVTTFYVNGVQSGDSSSNVSAPSGVPYIGSGTDTGNPFNGFLDEIRYSTFEPGAFQVSDLLLRPAGPIIVAQPQSATVWNGGNAPFDLTIAVDGNATIQWRRGEANIAGATSNRYLLSGVTLADSGATFDAVVTSGGLSVTSSVVTLMVLENNPANVAAYRDLIQAEESLLAYFPADGDSGTTLTNTEDAAHNGTLEMNAFFNSLTNVAFGQNAVSFNGDGSVQIPNNPEFEFGSESGTIEALVYLDPEALSDPTDGTIYSQAYDGGGDYLSIRAAANGSSIVYGNDSTAPLSWVVPGGLVGKLTHIALVFENGTDVTAYANGANLGTKAQTSFGSAVGSPSWIGSTGLNSPTNWLNGSVDELAIYSSALSENTIQRHFSSFFYGTNTTAPSITSQSSSRTLWAGASPVLTATVEGTLPISYQWNADGVAIAGETSAMLVLSNATESASYTLRAENAYGAVTSAPIALTFTAPVGAYAERVMSDAPTAYWRLSDTDGPAIDRAGFSDGEYSSTVDRGVPGAFATDPDAAAHFDGEGSPVPNVIVPYTSTLNQSGPFSIEFWAKPDLNGNVGRAVIGNQDRNSGRAGYAVYQGFNVNAWEAHVGYADTVLFIQGQTPPVAGQWYHVVLTWDGTNIARIFVNGADETTPDSTVNGPHRPNLNVPFEIGSRFGSGIPYPGTIDDVAFYNYKLSPEQILEHYQIQWLASAITQQPANIIATEPETITLSAGVAGLPNTYQWFKDDVALVQTENFDGTPHYPSGVNSTNLVISLSSPADSGSYHLEVTNPLGDSTSADATVTVTADTTPPTIASVTGSSDQTRIRVEFSRPVTPETAGNPANYTITGGPTVVGVEVISPTVVQVITSGLTPETSYSLSVSGVQDQRSGHNVIGTNNTEFESFILTPGVIAWDFYADVTDPLLSSAKYPNAVHTSGYLTNFSTRPITGGDLNNVPGFIGIGSNYGDRIHGWITPTVSGNYTFFISSDDASELWLSTDEDPANASPIAFEDGCCQPFLEPGAFQTSSPQALVAGTSYYIAAYHNEGGGGDYVEVAWRNEDTDTTPAASLTPIPGSFLSAYAPAEDAEVTLQVAVNGEQIVITWDGAGRLQESADFETWTDLEGNPASGYTVTPAPGEHRFYRVAQ